MASQVTNIFLFLNTAPACDSLDLVTHSKKADVSEEEEQAWVDVDGSVPVILSLLMTMK